METFIGAVELFPYFFEPVGWVLCDGRLLNISQNDVLYSLLGNRFGGDGITTFALPNLLGTEPIPGMNFYIATAGDYPVVS
ncbi:microcystin dependent protein [Desulfocucumis palustris]|uniref:Microcystin dependent protein n=1 Tax=Desulfocucumis palustris TaxID=1898651 RepID=A0A2L2X841_9FIRM|nr:tail fiber protein [Desulfocucumis palustris]GBF32084.1 microcystin dependent protein [Desulfocucumis palustris]